MNAENLRTIILQTQQDNTELIRNAEETLKSTWESDPVNSLVLMLQILEQETSTTVITFISIHLRKKLTPPEGETSILDIISPQLFQQMKNVFVTVFLKHEIEENSRRNFSNLLGAFISEIIRLDSPNLQWPNVIQDLASWSTHPQTKIREDTLIIFSILLENNRDFSTMYFQDLMNIVETSLNDPESSKIRLNGLTMLNSLLSVASQLKGKTAQIKKLAPLCLNTLSQFLAARMFSECVSTVEKLCVTQTIFPNFFAPILEQLLQGLMTIVIHPDINFQTVVTKEMTNQHPYPVDLRKISLTFVVGTVINNRKAVQKIQGFETVLIKSIIQFMMEFDTLDEPDCFSIDGEEDVLGILRCCQGNISEYCQRVGASYSKKQVFPIVGDIINAAGLHWKAYYCALMTLASTIEDIRSSFTSSDLVAMFGLVFPIITGLKKGYPWFVQFTSHEFPPRQIPDQHSLLRQLSGLVFLLTECVTWLDWDILSVFRKDLFGVMFILTDRQECPIGLNDFGLNALGTFAEKCLKSEIVEFLPLLIDRFTESIGTWHNSEEECDLAMTALDKLDTIFSKAQEHIDQFVPVLFNPLVSYIQSDADSDDERHFQGNVVKTLTALVLAGSHEVVRPFLGSFTDTLRQFTQFVSTSAERTHKYDCRTDYIEPAWPILAKLLVSDFRPFLPIVIPPLLDKAKRFPIEGIDTRLAAQRQHDDPDKHIIPVDDEHAFILSENSLTNRTDAVVLLAKYGDYLDRHFIECVPDCWVLCVNIFREAAGIMGATTSPLFGDAALAPLDNEKDTSKQLLVRRAYVPLVENVKLATELVDCVSQYLKHAYSSQPERIGTSPVNLLAQEQQVLSPVDMVFTVMQFLSPLMNVEGMYDAEDTEELLKSVSEMVAYLTPFQGTIHHFPPSVENGDPWPENQNMIRQTPFIDPSPFCHFLLEQTKKGVINRHALLKSKDKMDEALDGILGELNVEAEDDEENLMVQLTNINENLFRLLGHHQHAAFMDTLYPISLALLGNTPFDLTLNDKSLRVVPLATDRGLGTMLILDFLRSPTEQSFITSSLLCPQFIELGRAWMQTFQNAFNLLKVELKDTPEDEYEETRDEWDTKLITEQQRAVVEKLEKGESDFPLTELMEYNDEMFLTNVTFALRRLIEMDLDWLQLQISQHTIAAPVLVSLLLTSINSQTQPPTIAQFPNGQPAPPSLFSQHFMQVHTHLSDSLALTTLSRDSGFDVDDTSPDSLANICAGILFLIRWMSTLSAQVDLCIQQGETQYNSAVSSIPSPLPFSSLVPSTQILNNQLVALKELWVKELPFSGDTTEAQLNHRHLLSVLVAGQDTLIAGLGFGPQVGQELLAVLHQQASPTDSSAPAIVKLFKIVMEIIGTEFVDQETSKQFQLIGLRLLQVIPDSVKQETFDEFDNDRKAELQALLSS
ncbi:hypothetical protein BLNAU_2945 [Blattamonas nauphoetae]|uniref:IPO4/5-like TPR repeats domain-containing protein n=1 Tax=Blattamonas nauphoetae TaxID=2049346 RepID=A0ABQ9YF56_9EUKA|nr:hypothetical protein BLNAU_2945 [Blattamonas nauphoetae]